MRYIKTKIGKEVEFKKGMCIKDKSYKISGNFQNTIQGPTSPDSTGQLIMKQKTHNIWMESSGSLVSYGISYFLAKDMPRSTPKGLNLPKIRKLLVSL